MFKKLKNKIVIDSEEFDIKHILECGQIFSYEKLNENSYKVLSQDKCALVKKENSQSIIETNDVDYFFNFFDLKTDYKQIKQILSKYEVLKKPLEYGKGIRILKQDLLETIISFVISANNNIKRIQKSIFYIREHLGENKGDYFTFPSLEKLKTCKEDFFVKAGTGYRAKQLVKLLGQLNEDVLKEKNTLQTTELKDYLISLSGIGPKVADCILLFGYGRTDVFPVDTWISKVFNEYFRKEENRNVMRKELISTFKELSGYAQQYLFYYKREN